MDCRLCLSECEEVVPIFEECDENIWFQLILKYLGLKIEPDDAYSIFLCQNCASTLTNFHNLYQTAQKCQAALQKMQISAETTTPIDPSEEVLFLKIEPGQEFSENYESDDDQMIYVVEQSDKEVSIDESSIDTFQHQPELISAEEGSVSCEKLEEATDEVDTTMELVDNITSSNNEPIICPNCGSKFESEEMLCYHFYETECKQLIEEESTPNCSNTITNRKVLKHHKLIWKEQDRKKRTCSICSTLFSTNYGLKRHMSRKHSDYVESVKQRTCHICSKVYPTIKHMDKHMLNYHKTNNDDIKDRTCPKCSKVYGTIKSVEMHMRYEHNQGKEATRKRTLTDIQVDDKMISKSKSKVTVRNTSLVEAKPRSQANYPAEVEKANTLDEDDIEYRMCGICGKICHSAENLRHHANSYHRGISPFECRVCGEKFRLKITFHRHLKSYQGTCRTQVQRVEHRKCPICYKLYTYKYELMNHMEVSHKNIKSFACCHCKESFAYFDDIEEHVLEKSSKCNSDKQMAQLEAYKNVIITNQKKQTPKLKDKKKKLSQAELRTCVLCNHVFRKIVSLISHMREHHKGVQPFACKVCKEKFVTRYGLRRHIETKAQCTASKEVLILPEKHYNKKVENTPAHNLKGIGNKASKRQKGVADETVKCLTDVKPKLEDPLNIEKLFDEDDADMSDME